MPQERTRPAKPVAAPSFRPETAIGWLVALAAILASGSALPSSVEPRPERCEGVELGANNRLDGREYRGFDGTPFTDWDENGDGVLSFDEFEDCLGPMPVTFTAWDRNGDGVVSREEYNEGRGGIYDPRTNTVGTRRPHNGSCRSGRSA